MPNGRSSAAFIRPRPPQTDPAVPHAPLPFLGSLSLCRDPSRTFPPGSGVRGRGGAGGRRGGSAPARGPGPTAGSVRPVGLGGVSAGRRCRGGGWGRRRCSGEQSGSSVWDPFHSAQRSLVLFISPLLGTWNGEGVWKQLNSL